MVRSGFAGRMITVMYSLQGCLVGTEIYVRTQYWRPITRNGGISPQILKDGMYIYKNKKYVKN